MNVYDFYPIYQKANKVTIDSRKIEKGDIFFAFSGENFNAATLAQKAIDNGALAVIVEQKEYEDINRQIFYVSSTLEFLQNLAKLHRSQLTIPIIGLTGSNGKTTTKELITAVLSKKYHAQHTVGNLNNHIGVPLTILSIQPEHEMAVVELGANHQKEIEFLCSIAEPNFGYITNFGKAHLEGFGGFEGVIKGKSELYTNLMSRHQTVLVNEADAIQVEKTKDYSTKITFGLPTSNYYFTKFTSDNFVGLEHNGVSMLSQLTGGYNFTNLSAAVAFGLNFKVDESDIKYAIEDYTPTNMRSQITKHNGKTLILDTYNANPSSMNASLQNYSQFSGTKTLIMGDMLELGQESKKEHENILKTAQKLHFDNILTVGKNFKEVHPENAFETTEELIQYLQSNPISTDNVLLKGSRGIALEKSIEYI